MGEKRIINLRFPLGGLHRRFGYQDQQPTTTPDCLNVRPRASISGRFRGGSRPGLARAYPNPPGTPVNMLTSLSWTQDDSRVVWVDNFLGGPGMGSGWAVPSWASAAPQVGSGLAYSEYSAPGDVVRSFFPSFLLTSRAYLIELYIVPYNGSYNGTYRIFGHLNDQSPNLIQDGFAATMTMQGSVYSGALQTWYGGNYVAQGFSGGDIGYVSPGLFQVQVFPTSLSCFWMGIHLADITVNPAVGHKCGFSLSTAAASDRSQADFFRLQYDEDTRKQSVKTSLVAVTGTDLYREHDRGEMVKHFEPNVPLASDRRLFSVSRTKKLYIADNTLHINRTTGVVAADGQTITDSSVPDWTLLGIRDDQGVNGSVFVIDSAPSPVVTGQYIIDAVYTDHLLLKTSCGATAVTPNIEYRVEARPKVYDPTGIGSLLPWEATLGAIPLGCRYITMFRDRIVLASPPHAPHLWYMSRQGDPLDWDFGADPNDTGRAMAGLLSDAGALGQPINALIPYSDDYLVFGCTSSLWVLRGDPAGGGIIDNLSYVIGIVGPTAWCQGPNSEIIFLSKDGLYALPPGANSFPQSMSRERLPQELLDVDQDNDHPILVYDVRDRGIYIFLTSDSSSGRMHFWFDWETKTYWPFSLNASHEPFSATTYQTETAGHSATLLGCRDGATRSFRGFATQDEGAVFESYVRFPAELIGSDDYRAGVLMELIGQLPKDSGDVNWEVKVGDTEEDAMTKDVSGAGSFGTWVPGVNLKVRPRSRGVAMVLRLVNAANKKPWAVEGATAVVKQAGKQRIGV